MIQAPPRTILEVFESLPEGTLCQLINDHIIMSPAPIYEHQRISNKIATQLTNFVEQNGLGDVVAAPVDVYFGKSNVYQPDIIFISKDRLNIVQGGKVKGAPDLVIEILSPGTENLDRKDKKDVYEQFGVKEYWIVDPQTKLATGYKLENDRYVETASQKETLALHLFPLTVRF